VHSFMARKRHFTAALLHCCTAALLHCCTAALLHCCTAALLHSCLQKDFSVGLDSPATYHLTAAESQKADARNSGLNIWRDEAATDHHATANETVVATWPHWGTLMELPSQDILGDLHQVLAGLVNGVIGTNIRTMQEVLRVTSHNEFVELQQRFFREYMTVLLCGSAQLLGTIRRTAGQTAS
jgi:hypothetical protein